MQYMHPLIRACIACSACKQYIITHSSIHTSHYRLMSAPAGGGRAAWLDAPVTRIRVRARACACERAEGSREGWGNRAHARMNARARAHTHTRMRERAHTHAPRTLPWDNRHARLLLLLPGSRGTSVRGAPCGTVREPPLGFWACEVHAARAASATGGPTWPPAVGTGPANAADRSFFAAHAHTPPPY